MIENDIFTQIEQNLLSKFSYLPKELGFDVLEDKTGRLVKCGYGTSMFNIACNHYFSGDNLSEQINNTINYYNQPFAWWFGSSSNFYGIKKALIARGFTRETIEHAMSCNLDKYIMQEIDPEIKIKQVNSPESLQQFSSIIAKYDANAKHFYEHKQLLSEDLMKINPLFLSLIGDKPIGIAALHINADVVGVYDLITAETIRNKGVGGNMMKFLMNYALGSGFKQMVLSASSDSGYRIYEKLGFKVVGSFDCFEWQGQ